MSVVSVPIGSSIALDRPTLSSSVASKHGAPVTVDDALHILLHDPPPGFAMIRTTCGLLSAFFERPATEIEITSVAHSLPAFRKFLETRKYRRNSVRSYLQYARLLIRLADKHGWRRPILSDNWMKVYALAQRRACARLALHLAQLRTDPREVTIEDVEKWGRDRVGDGIHHASQQKSSRRFWKVLHELDLLGVDPSMVIRQRGFGIPLRDFPPELKAEVEALLKWKTAAFAVDRPKGTRVRSVTADKLRKLLSLIYGYTVRAGAKGITSLQVLLRKEIVGGYIEFSLNDRQNKGLSLVNSLSLLLAAMRQHSRYAGANWAWLDDMIGNISVESDTERRARKAAKFIDYGELAVIPGKMHADRTAVAKGGSHALAVHAMTQLLARWFLILPWRQRNVRECRIGGSAPNLYKGRIPVLSEIEIPVWAKRELRTNPDAEFWMIRFSRDETKSRNEPHHLLPRQLIGPLEEYLREFRPLLVQGIDPNLLFLSSTGKPLSDRGVTRLISDISLRYAHRRTTPHLYRDSFAYHWLREHPQDFLTVSKSLWHSNLAYTIRCYGARFNESSACCAVELWLDEMAERSSRELGSGVASSGRRR